MADQSYSTVGRASSLAALRSTIVSGGDLSGPLRDLGLLLRSIDSDSDAATSQTGRRRPISGASGASQPIQLPSRSRLNAKQSAVAMTSHAIGNDTTSSKHMYRVLAGPAYSTVASIISPTAEVVAQDATVPAVHRRAAARTPLLVLPGMENDIRAGPDDDEDDIGKPVSKFRQARKNRPASEWEREKMLYALAAQRAAELTREHRPTPAQTRVRSRGPSGTLPLRRQPPVAFTVPASGDGTLSRVRVIPMADKANTSFFRVGQDTAGSVEETEVEEAEDGMQVSHAHPDPSTQAEADVPQVYESSFFAAEVFDAALGLEEQKTEGQGELEEQKLPDDDDEEQGGISGAEAQPAAVPYPMLHVPSDVDDSAFLAAEEVEERDVSMAILDALAADAESELAARHSVPTPAGVCTAYWDARVRSKRHVPPPAWIDPQKDSWQPRHDPASTAQAGAAQVAELAALREGRSKGLGAPSQLAGGSLPAAARTAHVLPTRLPLTRPHNGKEEAQRASQDKSVAGVRLPAWWQAADAYRGSYSHQGPDAPRPKETEQPILPVASRLRHSAGAAIGRTRTLPSSRRVDPAFCLPRPPLSGSASSGKGRVALQYDFEGYPVGRGAGRVGGSAAAMDVGSLLGMEGVARRAAAAVATAANAWGQPTLHGGARQGTGWDEVKVEEYVPLHLAPNPHPHLLFQPAPSVPPPYLPMQDVSVPSGGGVPAYLRRVRSVIGDAVRAGRAAVRRQGGRAYPQDVPVVITAPGKEQVQEPVPGQEGCSAPSTTLLASPSSLAAARAGGEVEEQEGGEREEEDLAVRTAVLDEVLEVLGEIIASGAPSLPGQGKERSEALGTTTQAPPDPVPPLRSPLTDAAGLSEVGTDLAPTAQYDDPTAQPEQEAQPLDESRWVYNDAEEEGEVDPRALYLLAQTPSRAPAWQKEAIRDLQDIDRAVAHQIAMAAAEGALDERSPDGEETAQAQPAVSVPEPAPASAPAECAVAGQEETASGSAAPTPSASGKKKSAGRKGGKR